MKNFTIKTLNGMAYGLFATLIVGVILQQIGNLLNLSILSVDLYNLLASLMGVGIALGIGIVLKKEGLVLVMIAVIGMISTTFVLDFNPLVIITNSNTGVPGNPLTAYFVTIFAILLSEKIFIKKTPIDIVVIPLGMIIIGLLLTLVLSLPLSLFTKYLSLGIEKATSFAPIIMVIIISVVMGMILTAPISSAAIAFSIGFGPIAAGAAVVGTSIQMIGFAIQSRRDNKLGELISIGIGTSMLQFKNIVKKPVIWLPTILSSAIIAPIVYLLGFTSTVAGAGMGTSGLVGPLQSLHSMNYSFNAFICITIIVVFGGLLVYIFDKILYIKDIIIKGDFSLNDDF